MIVFTNYSKVKDDEKSKSSLKDIVDFLKFDNNFKVKVIDCDSILSIVDDIKLTNIQTKIMNSNDLVLRKILDLDIILNKLRKQIYNGNKEVSILTKSWTDIFEIICTKYKDEIEINLNTNDDIELIKTCFLYLDKSLKEYFDLVAESSLKDLIKNDWLCSVSSIYFINTNNNSHLDNKLIKKYIELPYTYIPVIRNALMLSIYKQIGYAGTYIFKNNINLLDLNDENEIIRKSKQIVNKICKNIGSKENLPQDIYRSYISTPNIELK